MYYVNSRFLTQRMSGVQRFAVELAIRLKKHYKNDVIFLSPHNILMKDYAEELDVQIVGGKTGYYWEQVELPQYLYSKGSPLLLNLCNMAPLIYKNSLYTLHDAAFKGYADAYSYKYRIVYGLMVPILLKQSKHVVTVSNFSRNEIHRLYGIDKNKISIVPNAVAAQFSPVLDANKSNNPYLFTVLSTGENKNFNMVLEVFVETSKKIPGLKLYAAGKSLKDAKHTKYKKYANNPNIVFLGYVSDNELTKFYSNALAFLYPTIYEGFGIPPLEAQMCGCPVVSSISGPMPEVLGDSSLCADPFDKQALVDCIMKLYLSKDLKEDIIRRGYRNVQRFSFDISTTRIINVIESIKL